MSEWIFGSGRFVARAARDAARGAARRPLLPLAAFSTLAICLSLVGLGALLAWNLGRAVESWSIGGQMTVYLEESTSPARATQLAEAVRHLPGVTDARLVSSKEAHQRLRGALGTHGELLDGVEEGFLPASIEVRLLPGTGALLRAHPSFQRLSNAAGIEEIDLHAETTERLERVRSLSARGALALGVLVALATLYLVGTTIRLGVAARREELEVLRLVGATEWFVRAPFLLEGLCAGALGAVAATILLRLAYVQTAPRIAASLGSWLVAAPLSFFPASIVALSIAGGALLGLCAAGLAVSGEARA